MLESTDDLIECILTKDGQIINENISDLLDNTLGTFYYHEGHYQKLPPFGINFEAVILNLDNPPQMYICSFHDTEILKKLYQLEVR